MNIRQLHNPGKKVSTFPIFKGTEGTSTAIQVLQSEQVKEHLTKVPALLFCIKGEVMFENEKGIKKNLIPGDYVNIEPMVKHWLETTMESQLILIR